MCVCVCVCVCACCVCACVCMCVWREEFCSTQKPSSDWEEGRALCRLLLMRLPHLAHAGRSPGRGSAVTGSENR